MDSIFSSRTKGSCYGNSGIHMWLYNITSTLGIWPMPNACPIFKYNQINVKKKKHVGIRNI
jgi:hypothetical protein